MIYTIRSGYQFSLTRTSPGEASARGRAEAHLHGKRLRDAAERAVCRFYHVPSLQDCTADKILLSGLHEYLDGTPFMIVDLSNSRFQIVDVKSKVVIFSCMPFQVERQELDTSCIEDAIAHVTAFINIQQCYTTFDDGK